MWLLALLAPWSGALRDDVAGCGAVDLVASPGRGTTVSLVEPVTFEIPAVIPGSGAASGLGAATLGFGVGAATVECTYLATGGDYGLSSCDDGRVAGELADADHLELSSGLGVVAVTLEDVGCALADGPCAGGGWGGITWLGETVHVRADGDDLGDGSIGAPVSTLARAHELARGRSGRKAIGVGPGTFDAALRLDDGVLDDDTWLLGCSPAETVLVGADPDAPVVDLAAPARMGVRSLSLEGGGGGLTLRDGVTGFAWDVAAVRNGGPGVRVEDVGTLASLASVEVTDPSGDCGWGVSVSDGTAVLRDVTIAGAVAVGLGVVDGDLASTGLVVSSTGRDPLGMLGRGVHAQDAFTLLSGAHLVDNFDAGVFLKDPRGAVLSQILIEFTSAGITANGGATGDGIVVSGNGNGATVMVIDNIVYEADRSAIVIDDADAWVGSNVATSGGVAQGAVSLTGPQARRFVDASAAPLDLNRDPLACP